MTTTWRDSAACLGMDTNIFYVPHGMRGHARDAWIERAVNICADCPVRSMCEADAQARGESWGVWAGQWMEAGRARGNGARAIRACRQCGDDFTPQHGGTRYCGDDCRTAANRKRQRVTA